MEQPRQLERPLHLLLPVTAQIGPQGIEQIPGVGLPLPSQLLNQRQQPGEESRIQPTGQGGGGA